MARITAKQQARDLIWKLQEVVNDRDNDGSFGDDVNEKVSEVWEAIGGNNIPESPRRASWWDEPARIRVTGRGEFPFDMLRRDAAWPAATEDANQLLADGLREITLVVQRRRVCTPERWESFGWKAVFVDELGS